MSSLLLCVLLLSAISFTSAATPVFLNKYLQPDKVDRDAFLNPSVGSNICSRDCVEGASPKICYYQWTLEDYSTMGDACGDCPTNKTECYNDQCVQADGYERGIVTANRKIPGPSIEVCIGDRVIVDVINKMPARTTTLHWHGVFQEDSQYMDGVPMLTQCGIYEATTFRYDFVAANEGTHFWHSHDGFTKLDGLQGNLVVRVPKSREPNGNLYDFDLPEHELFISDWLHLGADENFPGLLHGTTRQDADAFLVNGQGRTLLSANSQTITPYAQINVQSNVRYRMRIVGATCTVCPAQLTIEDHTMIIIATDGNPVAPTRVDSLVLFSGERYDVVVEANQTPGPYWIHVKGLALCAARRIYQLAVLQYETPVAFSVASLALPYDPGYDGFYIEDERVMNPENGSCSTGSGGICTSQLINSNPVPTNIINEKADFDYLITFGFEFFDNNTFFKTGKYERFFVSPLQELLSSTMNNISFAIPPVPPLSQYSDLKASALCPVGADGMTTCPAGQTYCECTNIIQIFYGAVVQILLVDDTPLSDLNHPFHLHGYAFYVMEVAQFSDGVTKSDIYAKMQSGVLSQSAAPVLKDTIAVPSNGYAIIKFKADNPGIWFLHCHFLYHHITGMALALQVGEREDWPDPPANFPKCGNFMPQIYTS